MSGSPFYQYSLIPGKENSDKNHLKKDFVTVVGFGPGDDDSKSMRQISQKVRSYDFCKRKYKPENVSRKLRTLLLKIFPNGFDSTLICAQNK